MNNNKKDNTVVRGGIGFSQLLTITFIVLKLTKVIDWSWIWVLAPTWISVILSIIIFLTIFAVIFVKELLQKLLK